MSYIPGTEFRMVPQVAPKAAHGRNYKKMHQARATVDREMKLINMYQQSPEYVKRLHANIATRENFLKQQQSSNTLNELERIKGILNSHRSYSLLDGRAMDARMDYLKNRMTKLKPEPLAGPEGLYIY